VSSDRRLVRTRPGACRGAAFATLLLAAAIAAVGCASAATPTLPLYTEVPIGPTAWPAGTIGQYGLHIDPTLLARLPATVDAYQIVEDPESESLAMGDPDLASTFDRYSAAQIGEIGATNWLALVIGHFSASAGSDVYAAWVDEYATGACSQANGVVDQDQETINFWNVDTATCGGGPVVYTLSLQNGIVLSMVGSGPLDLGRRLIDSLYS